MIFHPQSRSVVSGWWTEPSLLSPKLTGLAQLQLNKKGIASVKTQFTNMTSPLAWWKYEILIYVQ